MIFSYFLLVLVYCLLVIVTIISYLRYLMGETEGYSDNTLEAKAGRMYAT